LSRLKDVAAHAGVSIGTVARVLREDPALVVRPETRSRVLLSAAALDYRPNRLASGLRTRRAGTIALFLPDPHNLGWTDMVVGIEKTVVAFDALLATADVRGPNLNPDIFARFVLERRVDGVLVAVGLLDDELVARLAMRGMPMVAINSRTEAVAGSVVMADEQGSRLAVRHLADLGHTRIGHVTGTLFADVTRRREQGYRDAMAGLGLVIEPGWIGHGPPTEAGAQQVTSEMLALPVERRPTGILCANLTAALGAHTALRAHGYRAPADMSVIAFDDHPIEEHLDPPLTVVAMPMAEMGARGARMLFDAIAGVPVHHVVIDDQPRLMIRASTSALGALS